MSTIILQNKLKAKEYNRKLSELSAEEKWEKYIDFIYDCKGVLCVSLLLY